MEACSLQVRNPSQKVLKVGSVGNDIHVVEALGSSSPILMIVYKASQFGETLQGNGRILPICVELTMYHLPMQHDSHIGNDLEKEWQNSIISKGSGLLIAWSPQISKGLQSLTRAYIIMHYFKWKVCKVLYSHQERLVILYKATQFSCEVKVLVLYIVHLSRCKTQVINPWLGSSIGRASGTIYIWKAWVQSIVW
jgi:hypothetical protein